MVNLIKAQLYQLKKSRFVIFLFSILLIVQFAFIFGEWQDNAVYSAMPFTAGEYAAKSLFVTVCTAFVFAAVITAYICGADFNDNTANYEIMAGYTRKSIFLSRVILSLAVGMAGTIALIVIPVTSAGIIWGWGTTISAGGFIVRIILLIFPMIKIIAAFILLSYIVKNSFITMAVGFFYTFYGGMLIDMHGKIKSVLLSMGNAVKISYFDFYQTYSVINREDYRVYASWVPQELILPTIAVSIVFGAVFLYLGYSLFKRDDMR